MFIDVIKPLQNQHFLDTSTCHVTNKVIKHSIYMLDAFGPLSRELHSLHQRRWCATAITKPSNACSLVMWNGMNMVSQLINTGNRSERMNSHINSIKWQIAPWHYSIHLCVQHDLFFNFILLFVKQWIDDYDSDYDDYDEKPCWCRGYRFTNMFWSKH